MGKEKTKAELQAEVRLLRSWRRNQGFAYILTEAIRWGAVCFCAYMGYRSVAALAGRMTMAQIGVRVLGDVRISEALAWLLGIGGAGYGIREGRLRRETTERLSGRIQQLERGIDPKRTSSKLTPRGETPPEDA